MYLSTSWPILLAKRPECWPHTTNTWHALDINDEETFVVIVPALKTDTLASRSALVVESFRGINAELDITVAVDTVELQVFGCLLVNIVDEAAILVICLELECVEPISAIVTLLLLVLGAESSRGEGGEDSANAQNE
jgi:hypothetical protein